MPEPQAGLPLTRADDGTVLIGAPATGPACALAVLDVAGAVLTWSVLGAPGLPAAEIHDVGRAQGWLWAVYGEGVAAAVRGLAGAPWGGGVGLSGGAGLAGGVSHSGGAGLPGEVPAAGDVPPPGEVAPPVHVPRPEHPTPLAHRAARLALGHWAARWWPTSHLDAIPALEPDVLGLELAALTHACQQLFDDAADQPDGDAAVLLQEHRAALDPLIAWWHAERRTTPAGSRLDSVLRLLDDAADNTGVDGEGWHRLRTSLESGPDPTADTAPTPGDAPTTPLDLTTLFLPRPHAYALTAGAPLPPGGRVLARGAGTNDWHRYPPGCVDASETAVSWTAYALGAGRRIEVEVVADAAAPTGGVLLAAEVEVDGGPPNRVPLARSDDLWTGRADLDVPAAATSPRIEVGVLLPGFDPGPGTDDSAARTAVRALARRRLTVAAGPRDGEGTDTEPFLAEIAASAVQEDY
ncbi:hypothetical protein [Streptomyces sp. RK9]|uniref:hypothetical protein n=1 Tax=Streptomyces sp. RK9 TaxID=3239284 RepID=UPI003866109D